MPRPYLSIALHSAALLQRTCIMEREDDVIDLGTASVETQGPLVGLGDDFIGQRKAELSND